MRCLGLWRDEWCDVWVDLGDDEALSVEELS